MKKLLSLLLALSLLFSLVACGKAAEVPPTAPPSPSPEAVTEPPAPAVSGGPILTPAVTQEPPPLIPELPPVYDEALSAVLDRVLTVHPGSAGSSLRAVGCAAALLDWGMATELTDDEIYSAVGCWLDEREDEELRVFLESILSVYDRCYDLKGEQAESLLAEAGVGESLYPWNDRAFRAIEMVSYGCGLR